MSTYLWLAVPKTQTACAGPVFPRSADRAAGWGGGAYAPRVDVAVVTGAGRGLGRAIAARLAARGMAVVCADLDREAAEEAADEIGGNAAGAALDVADPDACRAVAGEAASRGRLAVWVNNAGTQWVGRLWEQPDESVEKLVAVNLTGVVNGCRAAIGEMRSAGGGRILNVASLAGFSPSPGFALYGATKHGVVALSTALDVELRQAGMPVEVRVLCPDTFDTQMVWDEAEDQAAALMFSAPRILTVDEVAAAAVAVLEGKGPLLSIPRSRGLLARVVGLSPRLTRVLAPLFLRLGDRARRRAERDRVPA
jgi:NAD(P)-dependent dehydrogenase (short-subunit alcohol dehydrogenase family)